jgi:hypothetical protein
MFLGVLAFAALGSCLAIVWLTLWAVRDRSRLGQFTVGSLLFLAIFVAMFFGAARYLADQASRSVHHEPSSWQAAEHGAGVESPGVRGNAPTSEFVLLCLVLAALAVPFLLRMSDSVVWFFAWLVRRRCLRRWLPKGRPQSPD